MVFPHLKPSTETISLRLPQSLLDQLKTLANKRDVPYQTLLKLFVLERVQAELHRKTAKAANVPSNYAADVPDLPGCIAAGATVAETESLIREAIKFHLEGLKADGLPIPPPSSQGEYVDVSALTGSRICPLTWF